MDKLESLMAELGTIFEDEHQEARDVRSSLAEQYDEEMEWYRQQEEEAAELAGDSKVEEEEETKGVAADEWPEWEEPIEEPKDAAAEAVLSADAEAEAALLLRMKLEQIGAAIAAAADEAAAAAQAPHKRSKREHLWGGASVPELVARERQHREQLGGKHPWTLGKADAPGRRYGLPTETVEALRAEQGLSEHNKVPWKQRGPLPLRYDEPVTTSAWRGQKLRTSQQGGQVRYANSGGKRREYYKMLARTGRLQAQKGGAKVLEHVPGWQQGDTDPEHYLAGSSGAGSSGGGGGTGARTGDGADGNSNGASSRGGCVAPWRR